MSPEYLLWDHDGVLVDTERLYFQATREVLSATGFDLSQAQYLTAMSTGSSSWDLAVASGYAEASEPELKELRNARYQELLLTQDIEIDGVVEVLEELRPAYRMAIVTTARRADFDLIHRSRGLVSYFEFVLTLEDYPRAKPAPDPYATALTRFGAHARQAVAIEDSSRGLRSAIAAGLRCVIIGNAFTASQNFEAASVILDSVRQLPSALRGASDQGSWRAPRT